MIFKDSPFDEDQKNDKALIRPSPCLRLSILRDAIIRPTPYYRVSRVSTMGWLDLPCQTVCYLNEQCLFQALSLNNNVKGLFWKQGCEI
jgi:hypothetical protein